MNLLERYIGKTVLFSTLIVLLLFFAVQSFVQFITELQYIGRGHYGLLQALVFVPMQSISVMYQLFPVAGLIGCLIGLGRLATQSELVVMRASGVSKAQINIAVIKMTIIMLVFVTAIGELVGPRAGHFAENYKVMSMYNSPMSVARSGWLRDGNNFIYIGDMITNKKLANVTRYKYVNNQLQLLSHAATGELKNGQWTFFNIKQSDIGKDGVTSKNISKQVWPVSFDPKILGLANLNVNYETLWSLSKLLIFMKKNDLQANQIAFAFYQRLFQPLATIVMICLAIPFIFGPLRSATMGLRMLVGVMVGFLFYTLNQFFGPFSMVYQVPPIWSALIPIILFAGIDGVLLWRVK